MPTTDAVGQTVAGMLVPYGRWQEVENSMEGHFIERWAYGSLRRSFAERMKNKLRGYFEHGKSATFGRAAIMDINRVWEETSGAWYEAELLDGLPPYMVDGLRRGLHGTSIGARTTKVDTVTRPGRSAHNPRGLEERTILEAEAFDISITSRPVYDGTEVAMRSIPETRGETIWRSAGLPAALVKPPVHDYFADLAPAGPRDFLIDYFNEEHYFV
jgi:phage head maturation protease